MPNLAISLHATTEDQRDALVPVNRKYGLEDIVAAARKFPIKRRSRITFEYVLLRGVNDTPEDARRLVRLLGNIRCKVNLIPLNEAAGIPFQRPSDDRVNAFAEILANARLTVSVRKSRGRDIRAACGQLIVEGARPVAGAASGGVVVGRAGSDVRRTAPTSAVSSRLRASATLTHSFLGMAGRNSHLQVVVGHHHRAVLDGESRPHGAVLRAMKRSVELAADFPQRLRALAHD